MNQIESWIKHRCCAGARKRVCCHQGCNSWPRAWRSEPMIRAECDTTQLFRSPLNLHLLHSSKTVCTLGIQHFSKAFLKSFFKFWKIFRKRQFLTGKKMKKGFNVASNLVPLSLTLSLSLSHSASLYLPLSLCLSITSLHHTLIYKANKLIFLLLGKLFIKCRYRTSKYSF